MPGQYAIIGSGFKAAHATITLFLEGCVYGGTEWKLKDVLLALCDMQKDDLKSNRPSLRFWVAMGFAPHVSDVGNGPHAEIIPVIILSASKHPSYHGEITEEAWIKMVQRCAEELGERLRLPFFTIEYTSGEFRVAQKII